MRGQAPYLYIYVGTESLLYLLRHLEIILILKAGQDMRGVQSEY